MCTTSRLPNSWAVVWGRVFKPDFEAYQVLPRSFCLLKHRYRWSLATAQGFPCVLSLSSRSTALELPSPLFKKPRTLIFSSAADLGRHSKDPNQWVWLSWRCFLRREWWSSSCDLLTTQIPCAPFKVTPLGNFNLWLVSVVAVETMRPPQPSIHRLKWGPATAHSILLSTEASLKGVSTPRVVFCFTSIPLSPLH